MKKIELKILSFSLDFLNKIYNIDSVNKWFLSITEYYYDKITCIT